MGVNKEFDMRDHLNNLRANELAQGHNLIRGTCSELYACAWLMENGWDVFRNVSAKGWADICAFKVGYTPIAIDVKTVNYNPETNLISKVNLSDRQEQSGIIPLYVTDDGICSFTYADIVALYRGPEAAAKIKPRIEAKAAQQAREMAGLTSA